MDTTTTNTVELIDGALFVNGIRIPGASIVSAHDGRVVISIPANLKAQPPQARRYELEGL